jgi:AraC family transcriptional regulator
MSVGHASGEPVERFRWVELGDGEGHDLFRGSYRAEVAGDPCPGVRVVRGHGLAGEAAEGYLASHAVVVNVGAATFHDFRWDGGPWERRTVVPTAVHVLPAGAPHAVRWEEPVDTVVVQMTPDFLAAVAGEGIGPGCVELTPSTGLEDRFLAYAALALAEEMGAGAPRGRLFGESLATAMALHLVRHHGRVRPRVHASPRLSRAQLARVERYILDHLGTSMSLRDLAALVKMDVYRFARAFKESVGMPPHRYVLRARIERAKELLAREPRSIAEVALSTGFGTPSHFATVFRRMTRSTPREFREGHR